MSAANLAWLAVIATGSQLLAVVVVHRLHRRLMLESWRLHRSGELTPEERIARVEEEARVTAEVTAEALRGVQANRPFVPEFPSRHPEGRAWTREEFAALSAVWPNPDGTLPEGGHRG